MGKKTKLFAKQLPTFAIMTIHPAVIQLSWNSSENSSETAIAAEVVIVVTLV